MAVILPGREGKPPIDTVVPVPALMPEVHSGEVTPSTCESTEIESDLENPPRANPPQHRFVPSAPAEFSCPLHFACRMVCSDEGKKDFCFLCDKEIKVGECKMVWALFDKPGSGRQLIFEPGCFLTWVCQEGLQSQALEEMACFEDMCSRTALNFLVKTMTSLMDMEHPEDSQLG